MNWGFVSSRALRKRPVEIDGCVHRGGAVFPFFNGEGVIAFCMVVLPRESRLYFFTPREAHPRIPLVGTLRLQRAFWSWSDGTYVPALDGLWHFDPDWLLRQTRFVGLEVAPALRNTNCCSLLPTDVCALRFGRDLFYVQSAVRGTGEKTRTVPITEVLPASSTEPQDTYRERKCGWRLDPVWSS